MEGLGGACNAWRGSMRKKERLRRAKDAGGRIHREPWPGCRVFQIKACRSGGSLKCPGWRLSASVRRSDCSGTPRRRPQQGGMLLTPYWAMQGTADPPNSNRKPFPGERPRDSVLKEGNVPLLCSLLPVAKDMDMVVSHPEPRAGGVPQGWPKRSLGS